MTLHDPSEDENFGQEIDRAGARERPKGSRYGNIDIDPNRLNRALDGFMKDQKAMKAMKGGRRFTADGAEILETEEERVARLSKLVDGLREG